MLQRGGNSLDPNVLVLTIVTCKASGQNNGRGVCSKPEGAAVQPQGQASTHVNRSLNSYTDRRLHFRSAWRALSRSIRCLLCRPEAQLVMNDDAITITFVHYQRHRHEGARRLRSEKRGS